MQLRSYLREFHEMCLVNNKISDDWHLLSTVSVDRSDIWIWSYYSIKERDTFCIVRFLIKLQVYHIFHKSLERLWTEAAKCLRRCCHFLLADKKSFIITLSESRIISGTGSKEMMTCSIKFWKVESWIFEHYKVHEKQITWYPCHGRRPRKRKTSVYARDSKSSLRLPVLPKWAWTLAYRTVPLKPTFKL